MKNEAWRMENAIWQTIEAFAILYFSFQIQTNTATVEADIADVPCPA